MKIQIKWQRGQALIIIAFAMIGLIAITGLAVDGGLAFSDRRHAQNAADTAAIAGAMAKIDGVEGGVMNASQIYDALTLVAMDRAGQNGYGSDLVSNTVEVYTCDQEESSCGLPYAGQADYVQVIITSHIKTFFAGVIGIPQITNKVQAVALAKASGDLYSGDNIIALSPTCNQPGTFSVEGNTEVHLTKIGGLGGLYVNSDDPSCGFVCNSGTTIIDGDITTVGGQIVLSDHCDENNTGDTATNGQKLPFPVTLSDVGIVVPPECTAPVGTYKNYDGTYTGADGAYLGDQITVLTPGKYSDFPPAKEIAEGKLYPKIFMLPGVYCVNHVIKLTENNLWLIGKDVTFFLTAGYDFNINGGIVALDAPDSGDYAGFLMIVEPDYGDPLFSKGPLDCFINGNSDNTFEGAIFAPYCNITVSGTTEDTAINSQIIGYTVKLTGGGNVTISYDAGKNPTIDATTGLVK